MLKLRRSSPNCIIRSLGSSIESLSSCPTSGCISAVKLKLGFSDPPTPSRLVTDFTNRPMVPGTLSPTLLASCSSSARKMAKLSSCSGLEKLLAISCCS